ncbi:hypothetical protein [Pseudidiomarina terrestris]|uniref:hypothetical protein n=1 Tax=Pseudidiomarina terrestris TaxID=2820060 RepID=UPI00264E9686|nr:MULTISPECIES: hypothetical protein [unclassified Pseudidiomarina]MDN7126362.1 hypothetical protein [Pseudidiomarina sp. 1APR75-33.1]MDN7134388.1 hypothetical protein [Pseudidiomarina sp. 1ASP75-5]
MKAFLWLIIVSLLLVPLAAPVAAASASFADVASETVVSHHADMAADHACCDESVKAQAASFAAQMDCDGSCGDCQHHCGASALALLPSFTSAAPASEQGQWLLPSRHLLTRQDRHDRPPMPANS